MAALAKGDWLIPTGKQATRSSSSSPRARTAGTSPRTAPPDLTVAPFQQADGYPEWKTKFATPALQQYFANKITLDQLATQLIDGGKQVLR